MKASALIAGVLSVAAIAASSSGARSPSANGLIAFVPPPGKHAHIYVIRADGSGRRQLTRGVLDEDCPRWSPDGKRLLLAAFKGERTWVEVITASGKREWQIGVPLSRCPAWSPNGSRIALLNQSTDSKFADLSVIGADGHSSRRLAGDVGTRRDVAWSADGTEIAYASTDEDGFAESLALTIVNVSTGKKRLLPVKAMGTCYYDVGRPTDPPDHFGHGKPIGWAPGKEILFALEGGDQVCSIVYGIRSDGTGQRRVTRGLDDAFEPSWSPDGRRIAFWGDGSYRKDRGDNEIWVINANGTGVKNVTHSHPTQDYTPVWSPDGRKIAFLTAGSSDEDRLTVISADGTGRQRLEPDVSESGPSWQPLP